MDPYLVGVIYTFLLDSELFRVQNHNLCEVPNTI